MAKSKSATAAKTAAAPAPAVNMELLAALVAANTSPEGYLFVSTADAAALVADGLAEVNTTITNPADAGQFATRATEKGVSMVPQTQAAAAPAATEAAPADKPKFAVVANVPMPESLRKGVQRTESYPFGTLNVGESFFIGATADKPNPERSYASTVASARNRYATKSGQTRTNRKGREVEVLTPTKDFAIRGGVDGTPYGFPGVKGAAVWRTK